MTVENKNALERIKAAVGPKGWSADAGEIDPLVHDQRGLFAGRTALLVKPASTDEVSDVVKIDL